MNDLIDKVALMDALAKRVPYVIDTPDEVAFAQGLEAAYQCVVDAPSIPAEVAPITGDTSDGYHTFNELYHHRAVLFNVICNDRPEMAWKSKLHHDGTMYDGMFIVGIQTPDGQATYHYDIEPYWDMFKVRELPQAPEWDGHTPDDAIKRIGALPAATVQRPDGFPCENCARAIEAAEPVRHAAWEHRNNSATCKRIGDFEEWLECSACNAEVDRKYPNCPYCTARMDLDPATEKEDSRG